MSEKWMPQQGRTSCPFASDAVQEVKKEAQLSSATFQTEINGWPQQPDTHGKKTRPPSWNHLLNGFTRNNWFSVVFKRKNKLTKNIHAIFTS